MDFLDRLKLLMKKSGDNNSTLAKKSGIPYTTIDGLFKRGWEKAQLSTIQKICECYRVSLDYMVYGSVALSDESLLMAARYESLDTRGRDAVTAVINIESKYAGATNGETVDLRQLPMLNIPYADENVLQARYHAQREAKELAAENTTMQDA